MWNDVDSGVHMAQIKTQRRHWGNVSADANQWQAERDSMKVNGNEWNTDDKWMQMVWKIKVQKHKKTKTENHRMLHLQTPRRSADLICGYLRYFFYDLSSDLSHRKSVAARITAAHWMFFCFFTPLSANCLRKSQEISSFWDSETILSGTNIYSTV